MKKNFIDVTSATNNYLDDRDSLNYLMKDMREYPILSYEEERRLLKKYKEEGDIEARNILVLSNQRFVYAVAKKYTNNATLLKDLTSQGKLGLMRAIENFDLNSNVKLISFAVWYIRAYIDDGLCQNSIVRRPDGGKLMHKMKNIKNVFYLTNGRQPSNDEVADILAKENTVEKVNPLLINDIECVSINSYLDDDEMTFESSPTFIQKTSVENDSEKNAEKEYLKEYVKKLMSILSERERYIIQLLYGIGESEHNLYEVAEITGLTSERVRQIKGSCLRKFRDYANRHKALAVWK